ncbi:DUF2892 domain-containing protein [bacterium]|nr:DUF2892 domain-containing protein [bacterium]
MKKNIGMIDRAVRILFGVGVLGLYFNNVISGRIALGLGVVAAILVLTAFLGLCPIYRVFGISSEKK